MIESIIHPALAVLAAVVFIPFLPRKYAGWILLAGTILGLILSSRLNPGDQTAAVLPGMEPLVCRVDSLSRLFLRILALSSTLLALYRANRPGRRLSMLVGAAVVGAYTLILAPEFDMLVAGLAMVVSASAFLIWSGGRDGSTRAGFHFVILNMTGWLAVWVGFALRHSIMMASPEVADMATSVAPIWPESAGFPEYLILAGTCICTGLVPAHVWLTDSVSETTIPGALVPALINPMCGLYLLARCFVGFPELVVLGLVTSLGCAALALMADDIRRVLGYAAAAQCGVVAAGLGWGHAMVVNGVCAFTFVHVLQFSVLFMVVGILIQARSATRLSAMGGLVRRMPTLFLLFVAACLSVAGWPLTGGFVTRIAVVLPVEQHISILAGLGLELSYLIVILALCLRMPYLVFYHKPEFRGYLARVPQNMYLAAFIGVLLLGIMGVRASELMALAPVGNTAGGYEPLVFGTLDAPNTSYTLWRMLRVTLTISGLALGFAWWTEPFYPVRGRVRDFEIVYRVAGRTLLRYVALPVAGFDRVMVRAVTGLSGDVARTLAGLTHWLDRTFMWRVLDPLSILPAGGAGVPGRPVVRILLTLAAMALLVVVAWILSGMLA